MIRRPGSTVYTRPYDDGSVQSRVELEDGTIVTTVLDADGRVLRRTIQRPSAKAFVLYDDTRPEAAIAPAALTPRSPVRIVYTRRTSSELLLAAFASEPASAGDRRFSLRQVRNSPGVRHQTPIVELSSLSFAPGSAAVSPEQADSLATLGNVMADMIDRNPYEVFLIQGHTDTTGDPARNLTLSDQRAESVALALTELFGVPPENMVIQGYGQDDLHEPVRGASEVNRRVSVRRVTDLLDPVVEG